MAKTLLSIALMLCATLLQAKETDFYQVDLIVFSHQQTTLPKGLALRSTLAPNHANTILLQTEVSKNKSPYHLLPSSSSQLREEYWALHRKSEYRVLLHYSWLQPITSQQAIVLPKIQREGWEIEGRLKIQRMNYYLLDSELLVTPPDNPQNPFVFSQKQRLKGGDIYYLDHPQAGMLIKIHQVG
jgi:hypothetical protein